MNKRILIFSTAMHPFVGGAEVAVKEITDRIDDVEFDMVTARMDASLPSFEKIGTIGVYRVGIGKNIDKLLLPLLGLLKARNLHAQHPYDGVWAIMASFGAFAAVFFKIMHKDVSYLLTLQEGDPLDEIMKKARIVRPLFNRIFQKADKVQAISVFLGEWARRMEYQGELTIIPNGCDLALFEKKPTKKDIAAIKKEIEEDREKQNLSVFFTPRTRLVISTSRLVTKNGLDTAIQSLITLPEHIKLLIVGSGPKRSVLEKYACERGVRERVHFKEAVDYGDIYKYLKLPEVFVFVRPSRSEGMGNSFIEAMAAGVPVVATAVGGIVDFVFDPDRNPSKPSTGLFAIPDNHPSVSLAIRRYYEDDQLRNEIIKNARGMVKKEYGWDSLSERMKKEVFTPLFAI